MTSKRHTAIDLFCSAGGLSEGIRQTGYQILAGNSADTFAAQNLVASHKEACFLPGPTNEFSTSNFL